MNEKTLLRYLKVKALAEGGAQGEKEAAQKILGEFETRHPGIAQAANNHQQQEAAARRPASAPPSPQGWKRWQVGGNWEEIFRYAAGFYRTVQDVVEDVTDAYYGQTLAQEEVEFKGSTRQENLYIRLKVSFKAVEEARGLNAVQKEAFRQCIHDQLESYLDALLQE